MSKVMYVRTGDGVRRKFEVADDVSREEVLAAAEQQRQAELKRSASTFKKAMQPAKKPALIGGANLTGATTVPGSYARLSGRDPSMDVKQARVPAQPRVQLPSVRRPGLADIAAMFPKGGVSVLKSPAPKKYKPSPSIARKQGPLQAGMRSAERQIIPAVAGAVGTGIGAVGGPIGSLVGGGLASYAGNKAQDALTNFLSPELQESLDQQAGEDRRAHPIATLIGEQAPNFALMHPGLPSRANIPAMLAGLGIGAGAEGANQALSGNGLDLTRLLTAAGLGAAGGTGGFNKAGQALEGAGQSIGRAGGRAGRRVVAPILNEMDRRSWLHGSYSTFDPPEFPPPGQAQLPAAPEQRLLPSLPDWDSASGPIATLDPARVQRAKSMTSNPAFERQWRPSPIPDAEAALIARSRKEGRVWPGDVPPPPEALPIGNNAPPAPEELAIIGRSVASPEHLDAIQRGKASPEELALIEKGKQEREFFQRAEQDAQKVQATATGLVTPRPAPRPIMPASNARPAAFPNFDSPSPRTGTVLPEIPDPAPPSVREVTRQQLERVQVPETPAPRPLSGPPALPPPAPEIGTVIKLPGEEASFRVQSYDKNGNIKLVQLFDGKPVTKSGRTIPRNSEFTMDSPTTPFVVDGPADPNYKAPETRTPAEVAKEAKVNEKLRTIERQNKLLDSPAMTEQAPVSQSGRPVKVGDTVNLTGSNSPVKILEIINGDGDDVIGYKVLNNNSKEVVFKEAIADQAPLPSRPVEAPSGAAQPPQTESGTIPPTPAIGPVIRDVLASHPVGKQGASVMLSDLLPEIRQKLGRGEDYTAEMLAQDLKGIDRQGENPDFDFVANSTGSRENGGEGTIRTPDGTEYSGVKLKRDQIPASGSTDDAAVVNNIRASNPPVNISDLNLRGNSAHFILPDGMVTSSSGRTHEFQARDTIKSLGINDPKYDPQPLRRLHEAGIVRLSVNNGVVGVSGFPNMTPAQLRTIDTLSAGAGTDNFKFDLYSPDQASWRRPIEWGHDSRSLASAVAKHSAPQSTTRKLAQSAEEIAAAAQERISKRRMSSDGGQGGFNTGADPRQMADAVTWAAAKITAGTLNGVDDIAKYLQTKHGASGPDVEFNAKEVYRRARAQVAASAAGSSLASATQDKPKPLPIGNKPAPVTVKKTPAAAPKLDAVTTPVTAKPANQTPVQASDAAAVQTLVDNLPTIRRLARRQKQSYKPQYGERFGLGDAASIEAKAAGASGPTRLFARKAAMQGGLTKFEPYKSLGLPEAQENHLYDMIEDHPGLSSAHKIAAGEALHQILNGERIPQPRALRALAQALGNDAMKKIESQKGWQQKLGEAIREAAHFQRSLQYGFDVSFPGRQGKIAMTRMMLTKPNDALRVSLDAARGGLSKKAFDALAHDTLASKNSHLYDEFGLFLPEYKDPVIPNKPGGATNYDAQDEIFQSEWMHKLMNSSLWEKGGAKTQVQNAATLPFKLLARGQKPFERHYITFGNQLRRRRFDMGVTALEKAGITPGDNPDSYKQLAKWVNLTTGRAILGPEKADDVGNIARGVFDDSAGLLSTIFGSPRFQQSRIQFDASLPALATGSWKGIRKEVLMDNLTYYAAIGGLITGAKALGAQVSLDPRRSDGLKIKIGPYQWDSSGGALKWFHNMTMLLTGQRGNAKTGVLNVPENAVMDPFWNHVTRPMANKAFGAPAGTKAVSRTDLGDESDNQLKYMLAPIPSAILQALTGKDAVGNKVDGKELAKNMGLPMGVKDTIEYTQQDDVLGFAMGAMSSAGEGIVRPKPKR